MIVRVLAAVFLTTAVVFAQPQIVASGSFDGCPAKGSGGDPSLNTQKNRSAEASEPADYSVAQLMKLPTVPQADGKKRTGWPSALRTEIKSHEGHAAVFTGYIIKAKPEGAETCNCESADDQDHDVHVYVTNNPQDQSVGDSAIVEVTPRWRAVHPQWTAQNLEALAADGTQVRITGWLLYDQEHWDMIHKKQRGTLWEIHPITKIEVNNNGVWTPLDNESVSLQTQ